MIRQHIDGLMNFLEPLLGFANCHMVDYFTQNNYEKYIPQEIQNEIKSLDVKNSIDLLLNDRVNVNAIFLSKFIENCQKFTLKTNHYEDCLNVESLCERLNGNIDKFRLEVFMTPKKSHEVEILSAVVASIAKLTDVSHIVDIGDGKGYLSSMLAFHHKIPVVGIDASEVNTNGSVKRTEKLLKSWKGLLSSPTKAFPCQKVDSPDTQLYKQVTQYVDENFDFHKLISEVYMEETPSKLGLVGLHTCGNLAPTSLQIFNSNSNIKMICNVGCCYHLLTEDAHSLSKGFPLSQYLFDKKFIIGRNARMIASQSIDRVMTHKELPNKTIYYRALLQLIIEKFNIVPKRTVGKFRKPPADFVEYCREAFKRIGVEGAINISDVELEELELKYRNEVDQLHVFYLLRCKMAPLIESLILLDRLLFLHERGFDNSFIVQLFDPVVSPRCYGIISIRN